MLVNSPGYLALGPAVDVQSNSGNELRGPIGPHKHKDLTFWL